MIQGTYYGKILTQVEDNRIGILASLYIYIYIYIYILYIEHLVFEIESNKTQILMFVLGKTDGRASSRKLGQCPLLAKKGNFLEKKGTKDFTTP